MESFHIHLRSIDTNKYSPSGKVIAKQNEKVPQVHNLMQILGTISPANISHKEVQIMEYLLRKNMKKPSRGYELFSNHKTIMKDTNLRKMEWISG